MLKADQRGLCTIGCHEEVPEQYQGMGEIGSQLDGAQIVFLCAGEILEIVQRLAQESV